MSGGKNESTRRAELEPLAGTDGKEETNGGNLNVPDEDAKEPALTNDALELAAETTCGRALDMGMVFSRIAAMIVGSEFPSTWAIAILISFERELETCVEAAITATEDADDEDDEVGAVDTKPAVRLLLVERGITMWIRVSPPYVQRQHLTRSESKCCKNH